MVRESLDLFLVILIVAAEFILIGTGATSGPLTVVVGASLALVLPGYALSAAVFGRRTVPGLERAALTLGSSLSVAILGGLVLDALPAGLQTQTWLFFLGSVSVGAASVAIWRRSATAKTTEARLTMPFLTQVRQQWITRHAVASIIRNAPHRQIVMGLLAVVVLVGAIVISVTSAQQQQTSTPVTQLWMLPDKTTQAVVHLGIHTEATQPAEYRLALSIDGVLYTSWNAIHLGANDTWQTNVTLPPHAVGSGVRVEADLYRLDQPQTILRHVSIVPGSGSVPQESPSPESTKGS